MISSSVRGLRVRLRRGVGLEDEVRGALAGLRAGAVAEREDDGDDAEGEGDDEGARDKREEERAVGLDQWREAVVHGLGRLAVRAAEALHVLALVQVVRERRLLILGEEAQVLLDRTCAIVRGIV